MMRDHLLGYPPVLQFIDDGQPAKVYAKREYKPPLSAWNEYKLRQMDKKITDSLGTEIQTVTTPSSLDRVRHALIQFCRIYGREAALDILHRFGANNLRSLNHTQYDAVISKLMEFPHEKAYRRYEK